MFSEQSIAFFLKFCTETNVSIMERDERGTSSPHGTVPTINLVETSFNDEDYPTEVMYKYGLSLLAYIFLLQRVILDRSVGKLGLSIIGGSEHASRIFGGGRPGVYVSKVSWFASIFSYMHVLNKVYVLVAHFHVN